MSYFKIDISSIFTPEDRLYPPNQTSLKWVYFEIAGRKYGYKVIGSTIPGRDCFKYEEELINVFSNCIVDKESNETLPDFLKKYSKWANIEGTVDSVVKHADRCYDYWAGIKPDKKMNLK